MRKRILLVVIALLLLVISSCGSSSSSSFSNDDKEADNTVNWSEAYEYEGESVTVEGKVVSVHYGNPTFINIGNDYPNPNRFQAIIWDDDIDNFTYDLNELVGNTIDVYGEIKMYNYDDYSVPEIVLTDQDAITY